MLKREITYEDFNGDTVTDVFYFNISKPEIIEMEVEHEGGLNNWFKSVIEAKDNKTILAKFKEIILLAYGQKSEDGKRFIKNAELRENFSQTAAYQTLFMELASGADIAAKFLIGVLPKDMSKDLEEEAKKIQSPVPPSA